MRINITDDRWTRFRIKTALIFFCLFAFVVAGRSYQLQVVQRDELKRLAERQYKREVPLVPKRGTIYSRKYEELAVTVEVDSVYAEPGRLKNPRAAARKLAAILGLDRADLEERLMQRRSFVWVARKVPPQSVDAVKTLNMEGIGFVKENRRFYPNSELASHVLGFSGTDGDGLDGIELAQDTQIKGKVEYVKAERDALGKRTMPGGYGFQDSLEGNSVVLTLDKTIQYSAERELAETVKKTGAKGGTAIVMDPRTGEVLALANYPQYNPNDLSGAQTESLRNRAIVDAYEPGSTFKTFLLAAAIEEGVVKTSDRLYCENGSMKVANRTIHDTHKHGTITVQEIMKVSSNIGSYKIAQRLGPERYYEYITNFGFGAQTGVGLRGEGEGILRDQKSWTKVDFATASFGQGLSVTPIQLATAYSVIANGGYLMRPYLVREVVDKDGNILVKNQPQIVKKVLSSETARTVTNVLKDVVEEGGTGMAASLAGYDVAGKTGTAQKSARDGRGYEDKHIASFIGFTPADSPEIVVLVSIDEPVGEQYGGLVAAPAFRAIAETSLRYLNTPKKELETPEIKAMKVARAD